MKAEGNGNGNGNGNRTDAASRLADAERITAGDPEGMFAAIASAGAQVRGAATLAGTAALAELRTAPRPRAVLVAGVGGSASAGALLAAVVEPACAVPVEVHRGYGVPGWVGPDDLVFGVSCSGCSEETLSAVEEAGRRGARVLTVGASGSPLAVTGARHHGLHLDVRDEGRKPRACLWSLAVPMLVALDAIGLAPTPEPVLRATAAALDEIAAGSRVQVPVAADPAKSLAVALPGSVPVVWGSSELAGAAAARFAGQLAENAKLPAVAGTLPEAQHNQVVAVDGPFGRRATGPEATRIHLVLLRDADEHPQLARRADGAAELAAQRGVEVSVLRAREGHPLVRLAGLIAVTDFASAYLAVATGIDPTPIEPIDALKRDLGAPAAP